MMCCFVVLFCAVLYCVVMSCVVICFVLLSCIVMCFVVLCCAACSKEAPCLCVSRITINLKLDRTCVMYSLFNDASTSSKGTALGGEVTASTELEAVVAYFNS